MGCVFIGSLYTFGQEGMWTYTEDAHMVPRPMPENKPPTARLLVEGCRQFYSRDFKSKMMVSISEAWGLDGVMLHGDRGGAGLSPGIAENRLVQRTAGFPVVTFESDNGGGREFDEARTLRRIDAFMETPGAAIIEE